MAPDGRVLVSLDAERLAMATAATRGKVGRIFPGTIGMLRKISRGTVSPFCLKTRARPPAPNYRGGHSQNRRHARRYNWEKEAQAGFRRTENGRSQLSRGSPGRITLYPIGTGAAAYDTSDWTGAHTQRFLAFSGRWKTNHHQRKRTGHGVRCYFVDLDEWTS